VLDTHLRGITANPRRIARVGDVQCGVERVLSQARNRSAKPPSANTNRT
jgi:hypothetical protein